MCGWVCAMTMKCGFHIHRIVPMCTFFWLWCKPKRNQYVDVLTCFSIHCMAMSHNNIQSAQQVFDQLYQFHRDWRVSVRDTIIFHDKLRAIQRNTFAWLDFFSESCTFEPPMISSMLISEFFAQQLYKSWMLDEYFLRWLYISAQTKTHKEVKSQASSNSFKGDPNKCALEMYSIYWYPVDTIHVLYILDTPIQKQYEWKENGCLR